MLAIKITGVLFALAILGAIVSPGPAGAPPRAPASALAGLRVGAQLISSSGELWGTVVAIEPAHEFPNGKVEPGVLVDYGPRMGARRVPPQWLPRRSAERFTIR